MSLTRTIARAMQREKYGTNNPRKLARLARRQKSFTLAPDTATPAPNYAPLLATRDAPRPRIEMVMDIMEGRMRPASPYDQPFRPQRFLTAEEFAQEAGLDPKAFVEPLPATDLVHESMETSAAPPSRPRKTRAATFLSVAAAIIGPEGLAAASLAAEESMEPQPTEDKPKARKPRAKKTE